MSPLLLTTGWVNPWRLFAITATICVAVPGSAAVKALLIMALWLYLLVQQRRMTLVSAIWFVSVLVSVASASQVGFLLGVPSSDVFNQGFRTFIMFLVLSIGFFLVDGHDFSTRNLDRLIISISFFVMLFKIAILVVFLSGWFSSEQIQSALGFESVQEGIGFGLQRLQFPSDIILQFLIVCYVGGRRRLTDAVVLLAITISVLLSFSRYLFLSYAVSLVIRAFLLRRFDFLSRIAGVTAAIMVAIFSVSLGERFSGQGSAESDYIRLEQIRELTLGVVQHPLFGTGMGSAAHGYTRSATIPFSYEVQWYALTMQLGIVGVCWFIFNLLTPLLVLLQTGRQRFYLCLVWFVWAVSGFTNPFIVSLGSGFGLVVLILRLTREPLRPAP